MPKYDDCNHDLSKVTAGDSIAYWHHDLRERVMRILEVTSVTPTLVKTDQKSFRRSDGRMVGNAFIHAFVPNSTQNAAEALRRQLRRTQQRVTDLKWYDPKLMHGGFITSLNDLLDVYAPVTDHPLRQE